MWAIKVSRVTNSCLIIWVMWMLGCYMDHPENSMERRHPPSEEGRCQLVGRYLWHSVTMHDLVWWHSACMKENPSCLAASGVLVKQLLGCDTLPTKCTSTSSIFKKQNPVCRGRCCRIQVCRVHLHFWLQKKWLLVAWNEDRSSRQPWSCHCRLPGANWNSVSWQRLGNVSCLGTSIVTFIASLTGFQRLPGGCGLRGPTHSPQSLSKEVQSKVQSVLIYPHNT